MANSKRPAGPHEAVGPDDSGRRPMEPERLLQMNRLAMQARFVSGLAHELNNSLQVMGGMVELLADRGDLADDVRARIQKIGDQADRAGAIVRQVLGYTRAEAGLHQAVDMVHLVDRALSLRRYQLGRIGVEVSWTAPPAPRILVEGDERQLQQAILNLLVNAEEALVSAPNRRLQITLEPRGGTVACIVADSGPGIEADLRERIFEPFFTTRQTSRNVGLGLAAATLIAEAHQGRLTLTEADAGAVFELELPARPA